MNWELGGDKGDPTVRAEGSYGETQGEIKVNTIMVVVRIAPKSTSHPAKPLLANDAMPGISCESMLRLVFVLASFMTYNLILGSRYA